MNASMDSDRCSRPVDATRASRSLPMRPQKSLPRALYSRKRLQVDVTRAQQMPMDAIARPLAKSSAKASHNRETWGRTCGGEVTRRMPQLTCEMNGRSRRAKQVSVWTNVSSAGDCFGECTHLKMPLATGRVQEQTEDVTEEAEGGGGSERRAGGEEEEEEEDRETRERHFLLRQDVVAAKRQPGQALRSFGHEHESSQTATSSSGHIGSREVNVVAEIATAVRPTTERDEAEEVNNSVEDNDDDDDSDGGDDDGDDGGGNRNHDDDGAVTPERHDIEDEEEEEESDEQTAVDELQALCRRCYHSLPFVALFLIYIAYEHATGILVFIIGTIAVMGLDHRIREQVALKDKASAWHLLSIVAMCAIDMAVICFLDGKPNPLHPFSQILQSTKTHGSDNDSHLLSTGANFWQVLWTVLVNDFLVRFCSIAVKALVAGAKADRFPCEKKYRVAATVVAGVPPAIPIEEEVVDSTTDETPLTQHAVSTVAFNRRKRKLYGIIEMCSIFLRSLLASIPWCSFYQLCASKFMADVFTFAYLLIKGVVLATHGRRIFVLARSLVTLGLEFGVYVSSDELVEAGSPDCSICYEPMNRPVKLACSHMFCEECVAEWFDHERSCPLCRADVGSSNLTEAENVKPQFLDGRTSLVPQLL